MGGIDASAWVKGVDAIIAALARTGQRGVRAAMWIGVIAAIAILALLKITGGVHGQGAALALLIPAVFLTSLAGGRIAGVLVTIVCLIGGGLAARSGAGPDLSGFISFVVVAVFATIAAASLRRTLKRLDASRVALTQAGDRIGEAEDRLRLISEQAPVMLWMSDEAGRCVHLNAEQRAFWRAPEDLAEFDFLSTVHPDDLDRLVAETRRAAEARSPLKVESRSLRHDGVWRVLRTEARPRFDRDGAYLGMIGVNVDITGAHAAEAALRESEERFRAIADTAPVLIWVTGPDRVRTFVNQAYVAYHGGNYEETRLADWRLALHPHDHERILDETMAGEASALPFSMEARFLRHDGEHRWLKSFSRPRLDADGAVVGFVGVAFDVTDMHEARARLEESESRFRTVADSAPALIFMTDGDGVVSFANRRYRRFFNIRNESEVAEGWTRLTHPDDRADFTLAVAEVIARQTPLESVVRVVHPRLGLRWLRCDALPRFDGAGVFQGHIGALIDVTDAKKAEDDLKRINELLEERVSVVLAEKARTEAELAHAQRMEAVGRLTGGVAHDFNNLLTVVIGALDLILRAPDDAAKRTRLAEAALAAARRGERLTHQLLAFSRRQTLRPEAVDLNAQIREGEPLLRRAVGEAVAFEMKLRRARAWVMIDPAQFEAALLNLVVNARDAVGERGRITVQTRTRTLKPGEIPELAPGPYVCVSVTDDGPGIPPDIRDRVFEPFFTTKPVGKGTGLGLSQVYGFARQSGGAVTIRSRPGRGAEIRLYLPPCPEQPPQTEGMAESTPVSGLAGRRLLLVEDDPAVTVVAVDMLTELGLSVTSVENGRAAMKALKSGHFDIMLTDVIMPGGMSGVELARLCAKKRPEVRVVLASGYAGEELDGALDDAPWPFLRKPYSADDLRAALGVGASPGEPGGD